MTCSLVYYDRIMSELVSNSSNLRNKTELFSLKVANSCVTKFPEFADLTKIKETVFPLNNTDSPVCKIKYPQIYITC